MNLGSLNNERLPYYGGIVYSTLLNNITILNHNIQNLKLNGNGSSGFYLWHNDENFEESKLYIHMENNVFDSSLTESTHFN